MNFADNIQLHQTISDYSVLKQAELIIHLVPINTSSDKKT